MLTLKLLKKKRKKKQKKIMKKKKKMIQILILMMMKMRYINTIYFIRIKNQRIMMNNIR
jgi:hypothetical protein